MEPWKSGLITFGIFVAVFLPGGFIMQTTKYGGYAGEDTWPAAIVLGASYGAFFGLIVFVVQLIRRRKKRQGTP
jgi:hypothetical protein